MTLLAHENKFVWSGKIILAAIRVIRPQFWVSTITAALAGGFIAGASMRELIPLIVAYAFATGGVESFNDFADRFSDSGNTKKGFGILSSGGTGVIQGKLLTSQQVLRISILMCTLALAFSLFYKWAIIFVALFILLEFYYSAKPVRLKERGALGPLAIGVGYGSLPFLAGGMGHNLASPYLIIAFLLALLDFGFGGLSDLADYAEDKTNVLTTFSVKYGFSKSKKILLFFESFPFLSLFFLVVAGVVKVNFLSVVALLFALPICWAVDKSGPEDERVISNCHIASIVVISLFPFCFL